MKMSEVLRWNPIGERWRTMTDAEKWCALNRGEWLPELGPEPDNHDERHRVIWPSMCEIRARIGTKECLREWNRDELSGQAFEEWWAKQWAAA
jgi:hypothetical protein